jgi:hypothetical protein
VTLPVGEHGGDGAAHLDVLVADAVVMSISLNPVSPDVARA